MSILKTKVFIFSFSRKLKEKNNKKVKGEIEWNADKRKKYDIFFNTA